MTSINLILLHIDSLNVTVIFDGNNCETFGHECMTPDVGSADLFNQWDLESKLEDLEHPI